MRFSIEIPDELVKSNAAQSSSAASSEPNFVAANIAAGTFSGGAAPEHASATDGVSLNGSAQTAQSAGEAEAEMLPLRFSTSSLDGGAASSVNGG